MTATHLALLRGINLGRAKRIAMADLRTLLGDLGYAEVRTLLNSGNAVFAVPGTGSTRRGDPAVRIESALLERLGGSVRVTVLAAAELAALLERNPLRSAASAEPSRCLIAVPRNPADLDRLKSPGRQDWSPETLALGPRAAYLHCQGGILAGRLATVVDRTLGDRVTARNAATMKKLLALLTLEPEERRTR